MKHYIYSAEHSIPAPRIGQIVRLKGPYNADETYIICSTDETSTYLLCNMFSGYRHNDRCNILSWNNLVSSGWKILYIWDDIRAWLKDQKID